MAALPLNLKQGSAVHRAIQAVVVLALVLFALRAATTWNRSGLSLLTDALIIAIAVTGLNLLVGFTGQISIGHSAFFGIGAYTTAILVDTYGWSPGWTFFPSVAVCFVVGVVVGLPALRLKGIYLALVTLALAVAFPSLLNRYESVTGGAEGIKGLRYLPPSWTGLEGRSDLAVWFFWLALGLLLITSLMARNLLRSRVGRSMIATRDNETAAEVMGVNIALVKTGVFGVSAAMAGLAGSVFALKLTLVDPTLFTLILSIELLVGMVIGGAALLWGPIVGSLVLVYGRDLAKSIGEDNNIDGLGGIMFGVLLIVLMFAAPQGLVGLWRRLRIKVVRILPKPPVSAAPPPTPSVDSHEPALVAAPADPDQ
jgi:branched-chain amino acid transport system permease protein